MHCFECVTLSSILAYASNGIAHEKHIVHYSNYAQNFLPADINECLSSPCGGTCVNTEGSFHCECPLGQHLGDDGFTCEGKRQ